MREHHLKEALEDAKIDLLDEANLTEEDIDDVLETVEMYLRQFIHSDLFEDEEDEVE